VFGPRQQPGSPYSGVISLFIEALAHGRAPMVNGDGRQTRDFTYVANVVDGVLRCCHAPAAAGQVINVAAGGRIPLVGLIQALQKILGCDVAPTFGPSRPGDVRDSQADITRARELLSFEPFVGFEEGLEKTVAWYLDGSGRAPT
jgi:nucleoside-diphosphate-sugar epimerase